MLVKMSRVAVVGLKKERADALSYLHDLGIFEIEDMPANLERRLGSEPFGPPMPLAERLNEARGRLRSSLAMLSRAEEDGESRETYRLLNRLPIEPFLETVEQLNRALTSVLHPLVEQRRKLAANIEQTDRLLGHMAVAQPFLPHLVSLKSYETTLIIVDRRFAPLLDELEKRAGEATEERVCALRSEGDREIGLLLAFPKERGEAIRSLLSQGNISEVRLPDYLKGIPSGGAEALLERQKARLSRDLQRLNRKLGRYAGRWRPEIASALFALEDRQEELAVLSRLEQTRRSFVAWGWAPSAQLAKIEGRLEERFQGRVTVVTPPVSPEEQESAPVTFANPRVIRPFESLLELIGPPRYGTFDPTPLLALFFVAFFGLIVGDIAYGLLILMGALLIRRKARSVLTRALTGILAYGGASSILFGLLFGEFLGDMLYRLDAVTFVEIAGIRLPVEREHLILPLFFLSLGLGLAHLLLGLLVGAVSAERHGKPKLAVERLGEIGLLTGLVLFAGMAWGRIPHLMHHTAYILVILGAVLLLYAAGPLLGPLHALELFRSVLSYLRLAALALAGMSLAAMANHLGGSVGNIAFGVMLALLLHALNLGFSLVSPAIHSLRLNLLEFFSGFYEAGGRPYRPFHRVRG